MALKYESGEVLLFGRDRRSTYEVVFIPFRRPEAVVGEYPETAVLEPAALQVFLKFLCDVGR